MTTDSFDNSVRQRAFNFLVELTDKFGDVLNREDLRQGFQFNNERVPLLSPQGIFKPKILDLPLSITTAPNSPYNDSFTHDEFLHYKYRGTDPNHYDNRGLREIMRQRKPLIYLYGLVKGKYIPSWPVYIIGDDPNNLTFTIAVDDRRELIFPQQLDIAEPTVEIRRRYITSAVRVRLHQRAFRERVLDAYHKQCALCHLRHTELLEAAHIRPDADADGEPLIKNGIALCKLHHAAFDKLILGIRPDYIVEIRMDILNEIDGPMLKHGLQEMHGSRLYIPHRAEHRPDPEALASRYRMFQSV